MNDLIKSINFQHLYFRGMSFDQPTIEDAINHLYNYLRKKIISPSPFIVFTAHNHIKTVIAYYAIIKTGKIAVILDPQSKSIEIDEVINDVNPAALIVINNNTISFNYEEEVVFKESRISFLINSDLTDVLTIAYTNAEDGFSKGAMLTEKNLQAEVRAIIKTNRISKDSVICALLPFSHLYGFAYGILSVTQSGASGLISEPNLLRISETLKEIESYKVTHLHTVPSIYYVLSKVPGVENMIKSIIELYSGGIQLSQFIFESFYNKTNREIREGYGLTECSPAIAGNYQESGPVFGSIGNAFPGCEIKILGDFEHECKADEIGEICVKGDMVFKGYYNHETATNSLLKNGWFHTGDFGKKDKDGNIYFTGLKKQMINIAGNKVYPKKLERLISLNKNVAYVYIYSEASMIQGYTVKAQFRLIKSSRKNQDILKHWCQENINNTMLPRNWQFD